MSPLQKFSRLLSEVSTINYLEMFSFNWDVIATTVDSSIIFLASLLRSHCTVQSGQILNLLPSMKAVLDI